jgi:hypothetical protein
MGCSVAVGPASVPTSLSQEPLTRKAAENIRIEQVWEGSVLGVEKGEGKLLVISLELAGYPN